MHIARMNMPMTKSFITSDITFSIIYHIHNIYGYIASSILRAIWIFLNNCRCTGVHFVLSALQHCAVWAGKKLFGGKTFIYVFIGENIFGTCKTLTKLMRGSMSFTLVLIAKYAMYKEIVHVFHVELLNERAVALYTLYYFTVIDF